MEKYIINGGKPLVGEISISGAKNAAVAILPATILCNGVCIIENLPNISDVAIAVHILHDLGAKVRPLDESTLEIDTSCIHSTRVADEMGRQMRASYYFIGALLGRFGKASVSMPGGCDLGARPIDQHLKAFQSFGADISVERGMINAESNHLNGSQVFFDTVSVGATINSMLAAILCDGTTILENVAKEPHIVDVANFLNMMGADVRGAGTDVIKIHGVKQLHGCSYTLIPDQIEAGTFMVAAAATGGNILVKDVTPKHLEPIIAKLEMSGAHIEEYDEAVRVSRSSDIIPVNVKTQPHPGFPTDMQPLMAVLLSKAKGISIITESIWDNRFRYIDELSRMGANVQVDGRVAVIEGVPNLSCAPVKATDLRAGAALVIAALCTEGTSEIDDVEHIERGYEHFVEKLQSLGADIHRKEIETKSVPQAL